jgi:hypothetical protein
VVSCHNVAPTSRSKDSQEEAEEEHQHKQEGLEDEGDPQEVVSYIREIVGVIREVVGKKISVCGDADAVYCNLEDVAQDEGEDGDERRSFVGLVFAIMSARLWGQNGQEESYGKPSALQRTFGARADRKRSRKTASVASSAARTTESNASQTAYLALAHTYQAKSDDKSGMSMLYTVT